ncbi:hypothetical protein PFICI_13269 [Pestalotiopsis fici W106-1]|uniref:Uncharacterized protein n=1 Tax=Pestalotiopsis fici (strain W106-1 / CGMCC3.15140) TaxID=1229662 RepID=W3WLL1_PESFW|nr:uncharacterized protein PFICI_13269 [Pestalotiopsis fici W106-1]ETS74785.1 hypothetical protein PFICI_13269 [Pestalotiopsis fici W106-1]
MSPMTIPDGGLHLESSESSDSLPMQAFGVTLNDSLIEDLINCVQKGTQIELFLGSNPTLQYGEYEEPLKPTAESLDCDLYLTNLNESKTTAHRFPLPTMSILKRPAPGSLKPHIRVEKVPVTKGGKGSKSKALQGKSAMSMALSSSTTRSLPTSPALTGVGSPMHNPAFAASQQQLEKNKEQRSVVVHELAVGDQAYDYLKEKWTGAEADLKSTLGKVADKIGEKYSMKKIYWKELDVWNYKYEPSENRQKAIENAKKQYDKQRLETTHEAWERLLEEKDRGKGIILSKLQAQIAAKGNMTPAVKQSKAEESSSKNSSDEGAKSKAGGEAMARSNSQPVGSKSKKVSERESLTKSLLSNKPTVKKPATTTKKAAPTSRASKGAEKGGKKFLSEEFVQDSSSEDEAPLATTTATSKPKPMEKPVERKPERAVEKPKEKPQPPPVKSKERSPPPVTKVKERSPAPVPKPKPAKSVIRAPRPSITTSKASTASSTSKRPRDEDDSSSSSGAPLMKRMKPKEAPAKPLSNTTLKHRPSDASQNSRATPVNASYKSKNTSPVKSSPLASSPPTNASDIDENSQSSQSQHHDRDRHQVSAPAARVNGRSTTNGNTPNGVSVAKKRPAESQPVSSLPAPATKKRVTKDVLDKAHKFDKFYEKYKLLHDQLTRLANPPKDQVNDLLDMRDRLVILKAEIRREVDPAA